MLHLVVSAVEEVVPEALHDGGADPEDLGDVLPSDQHVSVVQLDVHVRLFVQQVVGPACRSQTNQLPEVTVQFVASRCLRAENKNSLKDLHHLFILHSFSSFTACMPSPTMEDYIILPYDSHVTRKIQAHLFLWGLGCNKLLFSLSINLSFQLTVSCVLYLFSILSCF